METNAFLKRRAVRNPNESTLKWLESLPDNDNIHNCFDNLFILWTVLLENLVLEFNNEVYYHSLVTYVIP